MNPSRSRMGKLHPKIDSIPMTYGKHVKSWLRWRHVLRPHPKTTGFEPVIMTRYFASQNDQCISFLRLLSLLSRLRALWRISCLTLRLRMRLPSLSVRFRLGLLEELLAAPVVKVENKCGDPSSCLIGTPWGWNRALSSAANAREDLRTLGQISRHNIWDHMKWPNFVEGELSLFTTHGVIVFALFFHQSGSGNRTPRLFPSSSSQPGPTTSIKAHKAFKLMKVVESELGAERFRCLFIKMFTDCPMLVEHLILGIHVSQVVLQALDGPGMAKSKHGLCTPWAQSMNCMQLSCTVGSSE